MAAGREKRVSEDRSIGVVTRDTLLAEDGVSFLQGMIAGRHPAPPITRTMGFALTEVENGRAVFESTASFDYYNPIGVVHGGWSSTLLDSALGCAVHSTLKKGEAYTTLEIKVNMVRAIMAETGAMRSEAKVIHRGRSVATAEAHLRDAAGTLYAHATTTCIIFPAKG
jgi:uncharacterized protein (TIGR00369 family)